MHPEGVLWKTLKEAFEANGVPIVGGGEEEEEVHDVRGKRRPGAPHIVRVIRLPRPSSVETREHPEAYNLTLTADEIRIVARGYRGTLWAVRTLHQILAVTCPPKTSSHEEEEEMLKEEKVGHDAGEETVKEQATKDDEFLARRTHHRRSLLQQKHEDEEGEAKEERDVSRRSGRRRGGGGGGECRLQTFSVIDSPAVSHRGVLLDISRNRVPTPAAARDLIDLLSSLKYNHLQLYVEHTVVRKTGRVEFQQHTVVQYV